VDICRAETRYLIRQSFKLGFKERERERVNLRGNRSTSKERKKERKETEFPGGGYQLKTRKTI
jgi:hypothetical protein